MNKHYIRLDSNNNIIYGFSDAFEQPQENDICINENGERHFELLGVVNPNLVARDGVPIYKFVNGLIVNLTQEEINAFKQSIPPQPKSELEFLKEENASIKSQLAEQNQTQSDFMDYIFLSFPEIF